MIKPASSAAPTTEPTTIPAIAPPDSPFFELFDDANGDDVAEGEDVADAVGWLVEKVMKGVMVGSTTPAHLSSAPEL
jgi:hypothetical protein